MADVPLIELPEVNFDPLAPFKTPGGGTIVPSRDITHDQPLTLDDPQLGGGFGPPINRTSGFIPGWLGQSQPRGSGGGGAGGGNQTASTQPADDTSGAPNPELMIPGASGNPITQAAGGLQAIGAFAGNWFVRVAVIALGVVLIAAAAWKLSEEQTA